MGVVIQVHAIQGVIEGVIIDFIVGDAAAGKRNRAPHALIVISVQSDIFISAVENIIADDEIRALIAGRRAEFNTRTGHMTEIVMFDDRFLPRTMKSIKIEMVVIIDCSVVSKE